MPKSWAGMLNEKKKLSGGGMSAKEGTFIASMLIINN